ncbi:CHAT domain-containing protein [Nocardia africana]
MYSLDLQELITALRNLAISAPDDDPFSISPSAMTWTRELSALLEKCNHAVREVVTRLVADNETIVDPDDFDDLVNLMWQLPLKVMKLNLADKIDPELVAMTGASFMLAQNLFLQGQDVSLERILEITAINDTFLPAWAAACVRTHNINPFLRSIDEITNRAFYDRHFEVVNPAGWAGLQRMESSNAEFEEYHRKVIELNMERRYGAELTRNGHSRALARHTKKCVDLALNYNHETIALSALHTQVTAFLAARVSGRDVIYLAPSHRHGVAIRIEAKSLDVSGTIIPQFTTVMCDRIKKSFAEIRADYSAERISLARCADQHADLIDQVREVAVGPLLKEWPKMRRASMIPFGRAVGLPFGVPRLQRKSRFRGSTDSAVTLAPTARTLMLSTLAKRGVTPKTTFVAADPSAGKLRIPKTILEAEFVAAVWNVEAAIFNRSSSSAEPALTNIQPDRLLPRSVRVGNFSASPSGIVDRICSSDIVHLSCHGLVDRESPRSALLLSGLLDMNRIVERPVKAGSTFILSACSVGSFTDKYPTETIGFPTAILGSGAKYLIASVWPVPDSMETIKFMTALHTALHSGMEAPEALSEAVQFARREKMVPMVWAGYSVYGA